MGGSTGNIASEAVIRPRTTTNERFPFAMLRIMKCRAAGIMIDLPRPSAKRRWEVIAQSLRVNVKLLCESGYTEFGTGLKNSRRGWRRSTVLAAGFDRGQNRAYVSLSRRRWPPA